MNPNFKKQFATSIIFESKQEVNNEENLKTFSSSFIQEYVKNSDFLEQKDVTAGLEKSKPYLVGFAIASGNNRAQNAIELALLPLLKNTQIFENAKSISLLISSHIVEISVDEIGIINDYIQENSEYSAQIVMSVNEDKNLGEALAVTIILSC